MELITRTLSVQKYIALMVHDHYKDMLMRWVAHHQAPLAQHVLYTAGITSSLVSRATGLKVSTMPNGPMGGDQQIDAFTSEGKVDVLIFFWDPLNAMPHDLDVKTLLRLATVWSIPVATNVPTVDFIIQSPHFNQPLDILAPDYPCYLTGRLK